MPPCQPPVSLERLLSARVVGWRYSPLETLSGRCAHCSRATGRWLLQTAQRRTHRTPARCPHRSSGVQSRCLPRLSACPPSGARHRRPGRCCNAAVLAVVRDEGFHLVWPELPCGASPSRRMRLLAALRAYRLEKLDEVPTCHAIFRVGCVRSTVEEAPERPTSAVVGVGAGPDLPSI